MFTQIQTSAAVEIIPVTEIELPAQTLLDRTSVRANMVTTGMERHASCIAPGKRRLLSLSRKNLIVAEQYLYYFSFLGV